jgi:hypothetical protein
MTIENKLKENIGKWVIVHGTQYGQKINEIGKLSDVSEVAIFLDTFSGSFEKGCLASSTNLPYDSGRYSIDKVYNINLEVIYENPDKE